MSGYSAGHSGEWRRGSRLDAILFGDVTFEYYTWHVRDYFRVDAAALYVAGIFREL